MEKIKKIVLGITALLLFLSSTINAQQDAQYSMYMFNPLSVNPAYAGTRDALSIVALYRNQWTGFKGAPKTANLTLHAPIRYTNLSLGISVIDDKLGTTHTSSFKGNIAYKIRLNQKKHYLSFGLNAGVDLFNAQNTNALIVDNTDQAYVNINYRPLFNVGAGAYYYGKKHYLGFSAPTLLQNVYDGHATDKLRQINHYYLMGGIVLPINSVVQFKPSFVAKMVANAPLSVDLNTSFLFYEKLWVGAMYRVKESCGLNFAIYLNDYMTFGYAYEYTLTALRKYNSGSHEIILGFDLNKKQRAFRTPRYF